MSSICLRSAARSDSALRHAPIRGTVEHATREKNSGSKIRPRQFRREPRVESSMNTFMQKESRSDKGGRQDDERETPGREFHFFETSRPGYLAATVHRSLPTADY